VSFERDHLRCRRRGAGPTGWLRPITLARKFRSVLLVERKNPSAGGTDRRNSRFPVHPRRLLRSPAAGPLLPLFPAAGASPPRLEWIHPEIPLATPSRTARPCAFTGRSRRRPTRSAQTAGPTGDAAALRGESRAAPFGCPQAPPSSRTPILMARFGLQAIRSAPKSCRSEIPRRTGARPLRGLRPRHDPLDQTATAALRNPPGRAGPRCGLADCQRAAPKARRCAGGLLPGSGGGDPDRHKRRLAGDLPGRISISSTSLRASC